MKLLLIAYEFPPVLAAQSLRWFYLANALARRGDLEIHVLTTAIRDVWGFSGVLDPRIRVHRVWPGPFVGLSGWLAGRMPGASSGSGPARPPDPTLLHRLYRGLRGLLDQLLFPDVRSEWLPFARRPLLRLLEAERPDVVISSHEPGVDLLLGRLAKRRRPGLRWIADLGDPLLSPYTPVWRRTLDRWYERRVLIGADHLLVTNEKVAGVLRRRHGLELPDLSVVRQGFAAEPTHEDPGVAAYAERVIPERAGFTLLFTGNFYAAFRDPRPLIQALRGLPFARLVMAGEPGPYAGELAGLGGRALLLGSIDHFRCLALQRRATLLVNIGNVQDYQVPGKFYEYLGAGRPILHLRQAANDLLGDTLAALGRGVSVSNDPDEIGPALERLHGRWREGALDQRFELSPDAVAGYSWELQADRLRRVLDESTAGDGKRPVLAPSREAAESS